MEPRGGVQPPREASADEGASANIAAPAGRAQTPPGDSHEAVATSGFRKFREQLMAKKFADHDNLPIAVPAAPGLFIGSFGAANNLPALQHAGVTHILCVSPSLPLQFPEEFTYLRLAVADVSTSSIAEVFTDALAFLDSALEAGGKALVHCFLGRSRSAAVVLAFLMARCGLQLSGALQELRRVRPQAQPNSGFFRELQAFDVQQREKRSQTGNNDV